jgi:uncharacterized membrane protein
MAFQSFLDWVIVGLRWAHIVAILGWVGASLYFMWLESKLRPPEPAKENVLGEAWMGHGGGFYVVQKRSIKSGQVPSPVYWFRVEAAVTWVTGFLLLVFVYYWTGGVDLVDLRTSPVGPRMAIGLALGLLVLGWIIYDRLWVWKQAEEKAALVNVISFVLLFVLIYLLCKLFTGRAAFIHVGAVLGTNMVASVWTRIIPAQVEAVAATTAGRERNGVLALRARRRALHNTYMTLPVIFTMIAVHAPGAHSHPYNWLVLSLLVAVGMAGRHLMILFDRRQLAGGGWLSTGAPLAAALVALGLLSVSAGTGTGGGGASSPEARVPFTVARGIVDLRCSGCHSRTPARNGFVAAPGGISFDTAQEIAVRAAAIKASTTVTRTMPPHNSTGMTEEERTLVARWADQGARID